MIAVSYPRMLYHPVMLPIKVHSKHEEDMKLSEGWMNAPMEEGTLAEIKAKIDIKEQELAALKDKYNLIMESISDGDPGKDQYICPVCGKEFTKRVALMGHMRSHNK